MTNTAKPIKASTQNHLDIEDIQDDIVILKTGACSLVVQITAINFGLLSEEEQEAIIYAYAGLLNSLTFPIQIVIRSIIKDITDYIGLIKEQERKQEKQLLLEQLVKYRQFIESTVKDNQVLDKKFYIVVPFTTLELGLTNTISSSFQKTKKLPYPKNYILEKAKMNLYPKRDHLFRQFGRLGLQTRQLNTQQLLELFYNFYNQESVGQKLLNPKQYKSPMVQIQTGSTQSSQAGNKPMGPTSAASQANIPIAPFPNNPKSENEEVSPSPSINPPTQSPLQTNSNTTKNQALNHNKIGSDYNKNNN